MSDGQDRLPVAKGGAIWPSNPPLNQKVLRRVADRWKHLDSELAQVLLSLAWAAPMMLGEDDEWRPFMVIARRRKPGRADRLTAYVYELWSNVRPSMVGQYEFNVKMAFVEGMLRREVVALEPGGLERSAKSPLLRKKKLIAQALRENLTPAEAFKRAGVSKSHGYRILKMLD